MPDSSSVTQAGGRPASRIEKSIPSRPTYGTLAPRAGRAQLLVADGEGGEALLALAAAAPEGFLAAARILYVPARPGDALAAALAALPPASYREAPSVAAALPHLRQLLRTATLGTQIYLAGSEGLIGQATQAAIEAGLDHSALQAEHRGTLARCVQCVHCKGMTENVTTQPVTCSHCGLLLLVRDHYSRRLAAFQGVCINAEDSSERPEPEEVFR